MKLGRWSWEEDAFMLVCLLAALVGLMMQVVIEVGGALFALWLALRPPAENLSLPADYRERLEQWISKN